MMVNSDSDSDSDTIINEMEHDDTTIKLFIGTNLVGSYNIIDIL